MRVSICTSLKEGQRLLENQESTERNSSLYVLFARGSSYQFPKSVLSLHQKEGHVRGFTKVRTIEYLNITQKQNSRKLIFDVKRLFWVQ